MRSNYYHIIRLFSIVILSFLGQNLSAQSLSIQGELDKSEMKTGEQASVNLIIRTDNLPQTRFRLSNDGSERRFEVLELGALDTTKLDEKLLEIKARLLVTSFDSTLVRIPPIIVETPTAIDSTESFALNVIQPQVDVSKPNEFKGIKAPWGVSLTWRDIIDIIFSSWGLWLIVIIHLLLLIALLVYEWNKKYNKRNSIPLEPVRSLTAIEEFDQLLRLIGERNYVSQEDFKTYYTMLIEALKTYLDKQLHLQTLEQTSNEVLESLRTFGYQTKELNSLEQVFRWADLSKFAKSNPTEEEAENSMKIIQDFAHLVQKNEDEKRAEILRNAQKEE